MDVVGKNGDRAFGRDIQGEILVWVGLKPMKLILPHTIHIMSKYFLIPRICVVSTW